MNLSNRLCLLVPVSDDKFDAWVNAMEDEKIIEQPTQYRFIDPKNSSFPEFIQMQTIPRYVLIDDKGKVPNANFIRPSSNAFIYELNRELKRFWPKAER